MICFFKEHKQTEKDLLALGNVLKDKQKELFEALIRIKELEAKLQFTEQQARRAEIYGDKLEIRNKELLEDLLIASGVKMSEYQEKLMKRNMDLSEREPSYMSQSSRFCHDMTVGEIESNWKDKKADAIKMMEELEEEVLT